jgi:virE domain protein
VPYLIKRAKELAEWGVPETAAYANLSKYIAPDFPEPELRREIRKAYKWVEERNGIGNKYRRI